MQNFLSQTISSHRQCIRDPLSLRVKFLKNFYPQQKVFPSQSRRNEGKLHMHEDFLLTRHAADADVCINAKELFNDEYSSF